MNYIRGDVFKHINNFIENHMDEFTIALEELLFENIKQSIFSRQIKNFLWKS